MKMGVLAFPSHGHDLQLFRCPEVALRRGKTTTKHSQPRDCGQLRYRWVYPGAFISHLMWHLRYYPKAQIRQGAGWDSSEVSGFCTL